METNKKKWRYMSTVLGGNLHDAAHFISIFHPEWDVVAMDSGGGATSVVHREEITSED